MARITASCGHPTAWSRIPLPMFSVPGHGTKAWAFPIAPGSAACMPSNRPCCFPVPCPWPTSPSITWTSGPLAKATNNFTRMPRPWGSSSSRARSHPISQGENHGVTLRFEAQNGEGTVTADHDLVVLSLGMIPGWNPSGVCPVSTAGDRFVKTIQPKLSPTLTDMEGVFCCRCGGRSQGYRGYDCRGGRCCHGGGQLPGSAANVSKNPSRLSAGAGLIARSQNKRRFWR